MSKKPKTMTAARARKTLMALLPSRSICVRRDMWKFNHVSEPCVTLSITILPGLDGSTAQGFDYGDNIYNSPDDFAPIVAKIVAAMPKSYVIG
jgi:hypothetical protein